MAPPPAEGAAVPDGEAVAVAVADPEAAETALEDAGAESDGEGSLGDALATDAGALAGGALATDAGALASGALGTGAGALAGGALTSEDDGGGALPEAGAEGGGDAPAGFPCAPPAADAFESVHALVSCTKLSPSWEVKGVRVIAQFSVIVPAAL